MRTDRLIDLLVDDPTPPQPIAPRLLARGGMVLLSVGLAAIVILGGCAPIWVLPWSGRSRR